MAVLHLLQVEIYAMVFKCKKSFFCELLVSGLVCSGLHTLMTTAEVAHKVLIGSQNLAEICLLKQTLSHNMLLETLKLLLKKFARALILQPKIQC